MMHYRTSKETCRNEIELGMKIPMIESRASNIPMTKGITYVVITVRPIKIFVEYVGANMSIQHYKKKTHP